MSTPFTHLRSTALNGLAALALFCALPAQAQLPAPPVSPVPVVNLEYDAQGNPTRSIRAPGVPSLGLTTSLSYDRLQRLRQATDARSGITRLDYNGREDLTQVTDPRGLVTQSPRNGLGDTTGLLSPDTGTASHTFDAAGNLKTRTDSRGALAIHSYDALNRLTSVVYTQPGQASQVHGWFYDQTGPAFGYGVGRLTSTSYTHGNAWYGYDAQGRLTTLTQQSANFAGAPLNLTATYGYDAAGHVVSITYPSGRVVLTAHAGGLPASISMAQTATASPVLLLGQIQHEPLGGAGSWQWQFNTGPRAHQRVYDSSGRMVRYTLGGAVRDLTYDAADRISSYTHRDLISGAATAATAALNQSFAYDELGRLLQVSSTAGHWTYGYDANGNRLQATSPGAGTRVYTVAANSNRLQALSNPARSLSHDEAGNGTYDDENLGSRAWLAGYNPAGRMHYLNGYSAGWNNATYQSYYYNTQGQRVAKWSHFQPLPSVGTAFMYDQQGQMLGEYNISTGAAKREYIWLQGMPVAVIAYDLASANDPAPVFFIQTDHLDTPRVVLDRNGAQRWSWVALPFGDGSPSTNPVGLGEFELNLRMPGQYFDKESGLSQNWHRDYDAGAGRFTQSDPIGLAGGINTYAYVDSNPLSFSDPTGLDRWGDTMCLPTHVYIVQSSGNGKDGPTWGAAGSASNDSPESPGFMSFPANSFPDRTYGSPGIASGTYYGTYGSTAHGFPSVGKRGPGVVMNQNKAIPTLGPNPAQGGMSLADYVHMHCQNYGQSRSDTNRGSSGCVTVRGDFCKRLWDMLERQCNKNVIIHVIRN